MTRVECTCGAWALELNAAPRARLICHCAICQRLNRADQADICLYRQGEVRAVDGRPIEYRQFKQTMAATTRLFLPALLR